MKTIILSALISFFVLHTVYAQVRINSTSTSRSTYSGSTVRISNPVIIGPGGVRTPGISGGSNTNSIILRNSNVNSTSVFRR